MAEITFSGVSIIFNDREKLEALVEQASSSCDRVKFEIHEVEGDDRAEIARIAARSGIHLDCANSPCSSAQGGYFARVTGGPEAFFEAWKMGEIGKYFLFKDNSEEEKPQ